MQLVVAKPALRYLWDHCIQVGALVVSLRDTTTHCSRDYVGLESQQPGSANSGPVLDCPYTCLLVQQGSLSVAPLRTD